MKDKANAILRLYLKDEMFAYELETVLDLINDTYTSLRWLELAEKHVGDAPYGDSEFAADEILKVQKVEIGTPNFVELYGLHDVLVQTITYLGGISGLVGMAKIAGVAKAFSWGLDARNKWLANKELEFKIRRLQKEEDLMIAEKTARKLDEDIKKADLDRKKIEQELYELNSGRKNIKYIVGSAMRLNAEGKVSNYALGNKISNQERLEEKQAYPVFNDTVEGWDLFED
jgi:H2-forming N5,N10-methylenetetrahydromethanopterin dehydrogenase-like enzyme